MRAALYYNYGTPNVLQLGEAPLPTIGRGELLVRVAATTVNRTDCAMLSAKPFVNRLVTGIFRPTHPIPGTDFAGEVVAVADENSAYKVGDRLFGLNDAGLHSQAEYLRLSEKAAIALMPVNASFEEAVSCLEGAHYALNFLNKIKLRPGDQVLVNGASGGIGSALVQLLALNDVKITAVCRRQHFPLAKSLGAHEFIDYESTDFTQTSGKYNFIFDAVGKSTFGACKSLILPGGVYISSELGPWCQNIFFALLSPITALLPGRKHRVIFPVPTGKKQTVSQMKSLFEAGHFKAVIDKIYPFSEIREAYFHAGSGQKVGQVVVRIRDN